MATVTKPKSPQSTVLVREAQPRYNIKGKKLPKQSVEPSSKVKIPQSSNVTTISSDVSTSVASTYSKPVAVVGANCKGQSVPATLSSSTSAPILGSTTLALKDPSGDSPQSESRRSSRSTNGSDAEPLAIVAVSQAQAAAQQILQTSSAQQQHVSGLEAEAARLRRDLDVQLKVNAELKKLLVASVGEDLGERVERLARDRAELTMDIGGFSKKISEDYENYDKVTIQADMWRSKYLASRVMVEELGNARAYLSLQVHEAQDALMQLLNERHELRTNLKENHRVMQQVKSAFDPLNNHGSSSLTSTNVLDLSRGCQQLAEAVRFRLLPASAMPRSSTPESELWEDSVTRAEQRAHEVLSRPSEPAGSLSSGSSRLLPIMAAHHQVPRFHPHQNHDNITYNCCGRCKGEISLV